MNPTHALYYAGTLVFVLLDYVFDINLRAAFLEPYDALRFAYYLVLFACLWLVLRYPDKAVYVGTLESGITLIALIVTFASRVLVPTDPMLEAGTGVVTMPEVINFIISGFYGYYAYMSGMRKIKREISR